MKKFYVVDEALGLGDEPVAAEQIQAQLRKLGLPPLQSDWHFCTCGAVIDALINADHKIIAFEKHACCGNRLGKTAQTALEQHALWAQGRPGERLVCSGSIGTKDLQGADLRWAGLRGTDLRGVDLRNANLHGADLREVDLRGADLRGSNLQCAVLQNADLRGADLRGADLREADLRGAALLGAALHNTDLRGANVQDTDISFGKGVRK